MTRFIASSLVVFLLYVSLCYTNANALTINSASCSASDVQEAIDSASNGDTVKIPSCPSGEIWSSQVTVPSSKGIKMQGAGMDQTVITLTAPQLVTFMINTDDQSAMFELSNITFYEGNNSTALIRISGDGKFRLHHLEFDVGSSTSTSVLIGGWTLGGSFGPFGVIDNCTWHGTQMGGINIRVDSGDPSWASEPMSIGGANAVYVEESTFDFDSYVSGQGAIDCAYGGRYVFRYNTVKNADVKSHGYESSLESCLQTEVYKNTFTFDSGEPLTRVVFLRGGTGYVHNNTLSISGGPGGGEKHLVDLANFRDSNKINTPCICDGGCYVDGNEQPNGYPCHDQVGRGTGQSLVPFYEYENYINGEEADCHNDYPIHIQENRDYYNDTLKPGYTEYEYPHPLRIPEPPGNLRIVGD
jgi:hypothetical protein